MSMWQVLTKLEIYLLFGAVLAYGGAMLIFWVQLFLRNGGPDNSAPEGEPPRRSSAMAAAIGLLLVGAVMHGVSLVGQGSELFHHELGVVGLFGWIMVLAYFISGRRLGWLSTGAFVTPIVLLAALYSLTAVNLHHPPERLVKKLELPWLYGHIFLIVAGCVALAFAFAACLIYLLLEGLLKRKRFTGLWHKLPSLLTADTLIYRATCFGEALLLLGLVISFVWQQRYHPNESVLQDPKVIFSCITWAIFALYLAVRQLLGWRGRRTNLVVVLGFVMMLVLFTVQHGLSGAAQ